MGRSRHASKRKRIRPHYYVFCEGRTEETYICFLRSKYRIPIEIVTKVTGSNISNRLINSHKRGNPIHEKDKDFLVYDGDVLEVLERLQNIESVTLLVSNPSIELWFLYHYKNQTAAISTEECIRQLENRNNNQYRKGVLDKKLHEKLDTRISMACNRAEQSQPFNNPSTNINELIAILEENSQ